MTETQDPGRLMARIGEAIEAGQGGQTARAAELFAGLWAEVEAGSPFHRLLVAHYGADVHADPAESLRWNQLALSAADSVTDDAVQTHHPELQVAAFYPSLHLNLARDHLDLGDVPAARAHVAAAEAGIGELADDGYGRMIRAGIARVAAELAGEPPPVDPRIHLRSACATHDHGHD